MSVLVFSGTLLATCHAAATCDGEPQPQLHALPLLEVLVQNISNYETRGFAYSSPRRDVVVVGPTSHFRSIGASSLKQRSAAGLAERQGAETLRAVSVTANYCTVLYQGRAGRDLCERWSAHQN